MVTKNYDPTSIKLRILKISEHLAIANLEAIARHAGISRLTADKYLTQLVAEGKIREVRVGNNRLFVQEESDRTPPEGVNNEQSKNTPIVTIQGTSDPGEV